MYRQLKAVVFFSDMSVNMFSSISSSDCFQLAAVGYRERLTIADSLFVVRMRCPQGSRCGSCCITHVNPAIDRTANAPKNFGLPVITKSETEKVASASVVTAAILQHVRAGEDCVLASIG